MNLPVAMAFDPAGRLFYTEKTGAVRLFAGGQLQPEQVIRFTVETGTERGLLGIALDPAFNDNRFVYVYYTCKAGTEDCPDPENRVVRFVERDGQGSDPVTIFATPQWDGIHAGGNIHFGPDGKLYVSVGDNGQPENGQLLSTPSGKIHRINADGTVPEDNPDFAGAALPSLYARGLRDSFDFTFDPVVPGRIFAGENGPGCDDEMNRIEAGYNYGWRHNYPCDDDNGPDAYFNTIKPLWYVREEACCLAPTGIEVYRGSQIPEWRNHIFMATFNSGALYHFTLNTGRTEVVSARIVDGVRANMDIESGPDGALYFIEGGGYGEGTLRRITSEPPTEPTAQSQPTPGATALPGSGSHTFPETGQTVSGIFLDYWRSHGGLPQQGYPISGVMVEKSDLDGKEYAVQYFERAVLEYHPENAPPFQVLLSQLGTFRYREKYSEGAPSQQPNMAEGSVPVPETGKRLGGWFLEHWRENGGLAQNGYPISDEFVERSDLDGREYLVQYFERAVFELHPENAGTPYRVLLSQLGTFRYRGK
jgi:glucose/arabinose dehydrogenase